MDRSWDDLFDELVELPPAEQESRLAEIAAAAPHLAARLGALVAADRSRSGPALTEVGRRVPGLLAAAISTEAAGKPRAPIDRRGERIGAYVLISRVGRGGMGEVWLAERADGEFEARVAIKLIRPGLDGPRSDSESIHERFLRERRILAQLAHPGIARLLDGGRTARGEPYLVLEYVAGRPITDWCAARRLPLPERLELLAEVCDAVDHAHRALVVHRDLKPSNVLVDAQDRPKLLDFGIAKIVEETQPAAAGAGTEVWKASALTPAYAAPELILGQPVGTGADVYSLGVLLYELATGSHPHPGRSGSSDDLAGEVERETLVLPSARLRDRAGREPAPAPRRPPVRLLRDLDAVIGKALARDPADRYPGAAALADDLRRLLAQRPVAARSGGQLYRAGCFVRRNRFAVAAAALALLALSTGFGVALWQSAEARAQAHRTERVQRYLVELFARADPHGELGDRLTVRQLIERSLPRLDEGLGAEPELKAELRDVVAQMLQGVGATDAAAPVAERALSEFRTLLGPDHPRTLLAELTVVETLSELGRLDGLAERTRRVLAGLERHHPGGGREVDRATKALAVVLGELGDFPGAEAAIRRQLAALEERGEGDSAQAAELHQGLGAMSMALSRPAEAEVEYNRALAILDRRGLRRTPSGAAALATLAEVVGDRGDAATSRALFEEGVAIARSVYPPGAANLGRMLLPYGSELSRQGRREEARPVLEEAARIFSAFGHYNAAAALRYLGFDLLALERFDEAHAVFVRGEELARRFAGDDHFVTYALVQARGDAESRLGRLAEGEARLRAGLAGLAGTFGADSDFVRIPLRQLGANLRLQGRIDEALAAHLRARAIESRLFPDAPDPGQAATARELALDHLAAGGDGELALARAEIDAALAGAGGGDPLQRGRSLLASAEIAAAAGDPLRARRDAEAALDLLRAGGLGEEAPSVVAAQRLLARPTRGHFSSVLSSSLFLASRPARMRHM